MVDSLFFMRITNLLTIALLIVCGCRSHGEQPTAPPRPVRVAVVSQAQYLDKDFAGMSTADDAVNLAFKIAGQVLTVDVSKGQAVRRDELLATLNPRDVELQLQSARSAYEEAQSQLRRMERLYDHEAVSKQEVEEAQNRFTQARSAYENASDMVADTKLRAPFAGVIERTYVDAYQRVESGQTILRLVNPISTTVEFTMPESGLHLLSENDIRFWVEFDNYAGVRFAARLKNFARTSSDASGFPVALRLIDVDTQRYNILPGMSCTVTMQSLRHRSDEVSLPISAIYAPAQGGEYVWVVRDGRVSRRAVTTDSLLGTQSVVVSGKIEAGDTVVVSGVYRLSEGEKVKIIE